MRIWPSGVSWMAYRRQPGSSWTSAMAGERAATTLSKDPSLGVNMAVTTTGMGSLGVGGRTGTSAAGQVAFGESASEHEFKRTDGKHVQRRRITLRAACTHSV